MVIVRLAGGLGNQMFEYAAARSLALYHQTALKLDLSFFQYQEIPHLTPRSFALAPFNIITEIATPHEIARFMDKDRHKFAKLRSRIEKRFKMPNRREIFREPGFSSFRPEIFKTAKNVYLQGSWQSEKYFANFSKVLRRDFTFKFDMTPPSRAVAHKIEQCTSVSLHVRRGDYVSDPVIRKIHNVCTLDYYAKCIRIMTESVHNPHIFIFSDDPEWVAENMKLDCPTTHVTCNRMLEHEDLRLMSMCEHHIIANSSFSWWGAWLNPNPTKIVLAPFRWFNPPEQNEQRTLDTRDLLPTSWIRVQN